MELNQQPNPKNPPPRTNPIHNLLQYLLNRLWKVLPESARQETLQTLTRMLAQQIAQFPGRKEVPHEHS
jgi:hypothetical protein